MTTRDTRPRPPGMVIGSVVAIAFGTVFVMVNSSDLRTPWPLAVRVAGLVVAVALLAALAVLVRSTEEAAPADTQDDRHSRFWLVVLLEAVALFGGLAVINGVLDRPSVAVAWVALVVGVHFLALAAIWRMPMYRWLGAAMTLLGLAGFLIDLAGGTRASVELVAGVGSGVALYAAVGIVVREALRDEAPLST